MHPQRSSRRVAIITSHEGIPVLAGVRPSQEEADRHIKLMREATGSEHPYTTLPFVGKPPTR